MDQPDLCPDSHATLLLASHLGADTEATNAESGLGPAGWADFTRALHEAGADGPGELLGADLEAYPEDLWTDDTNREWVATRLDRSTQLAMRLDDLNNRGIWVTTRHEPTYPDRLGDSLGRQAPPFLYIAGEAENLQQPAVGFVGSREADETDRGHTRDLVAAVMDDGFGVVSGGARGIDETSEDTGLDHGGPVVEFPAEGLQNSLQDDIVRDAVMDGGLTLASQYHPKASWSVGAAMGRNRLIHGFGEYTVVVRSGDESGGTWAGATENLDNGWSTVLVCTDGRELPGNQALLDRGAIPIDPTQIPSNKAFTDWAKERVESIDEEASQSGADDESNDDADAEPDAARQSSLDRFN